MKRFLKKDTSNLKSGMLEMSRVKHQSVLDEFYPRSMRILLVYKHGRGRDGQFVPVLREDHLKALGRGG